MSTHTLCQAWLPKTACIGGKKTKKRSPSAAGDRTKVVHQTHKAGWRQSWKREEFTVLGESAGDKSTEEGKKKKEVTRRMDVREQPEKRSPSGAVTERETQQERAKEKEGGWEKAFWREERRGGGAFFCWGFWASPDLQQCTAQAESKVLCSHFSYHVVTFDQAQGPVCSNESPCAPNARW